MCVSVCEFVCACVFVRVHVCDCVCVHVYVGVGVCVSACVRVLTVELVGYLDEEVAERDLLAASRG